MESVFYIAMAIVAGLLVVAIYYQWRLHQLRQKLRAQHQLASEVEQKHRDQVGSSMQIICRALIAGQVGSVEASIRLSGLMDQLGWADDMRQDYAVFDKMAQAVRHIPILDAWKNLPKEQKRQFEREMQQHEELLRDFILDAAGKMVARSSADRT